MGAYLPKSPEEPLQEDTEGEELEAFGMFAGKLAEAVFGTCTSDVVWCQNLVTVAEAQDESGVFIALAALGLTVAAVQIHLDFSFAMTLHG